MTITLHLEVPVTDTLPDKAGFADHTETRRQAGVRAVQVRHPVGDTSLLIVDLDFGSAPEAEKFLGFLQEQVWRRDHPVLAGEPRGDDPRAARHRLKLPVCEYQLS